jgi:hypothetical protein
MSFWKVLGGAAAGIACVVALPIAGPIGAITAVGAAVAGTVGAAAGGVATAMGDDVEAKAEKRGEQRAKAEYDKKYSKLATAFERTEKHFTEATDYFNLVIAMEAIGLACAACDGEICADERREIDEFVAGIASGGLPSNVKSKIQQMAENPPNLMTAFALVKKLNVQSYELFDEIIEVVMHADGYVHHKEEAFFQAWNNLTAA